MKTKILLLTLLAAMTCAAAPAPPFLRTQFTTNLGASALATVSTNWWTLAVVPDTQYSTNVTQAALGAYLQSIRYSKNLRMVMTTGDTVDDVLSAAQWRNSTNLFYPLRADGIPHLITLGNHDYDESSMGWTHTPPWATNWSVNYGSAYYSGLTWFNGSNYGTNTDNTFITQRIAGQDWLFMTLEVGPRAAVAAWAKGIITNHPTHRVIVATHVYLRQEGTRDGIVVRPAYYQFGIHDAQGTNDVTRYDAEQLWQTTFKDCLNIVAVLSGHFINYFNEATANLRALHGPGRNIAYGTAGNAVHEIVQDFQGQEVETLAEKQGGYVRLFTFNGDTVHVQTYSATGATNMTDAVNDFTIALNQAPRVPGALSVSGLSAYTRTISPPDSDLADGLFFYAPLNEQFGTNMLDVISGTVGHPYARAGHAVDVPYTTNGLRGSALTFGNWTHVDFGNVPSPPLSALTVSTWYNCGPAASSSDGCLVSRHYGGAAGQFWLCVWPSSSAITVKLIDAASTSVTRTFTTPQQALDSVWHNYAFVYDGTNVTGYFDGQSLGAQAGPGGSPFLMTSTASVWLGDYSGMGGGDEYTLSGTLDEVKLWSRALSPDEMAYIARASPLGLTRTTAIQSLSVGTAIVANAPVVRVVGNGGAVDLTCAPTVADGVDGQVLEIWGTDNTYTVTVSDAGRLTGCNLQLGEQTRVLGLYDCLRLRFNRATGYWLETGFSGAGSGGSLSGNNTWTGNNTFEGWVHFSGSSSNTADSLYSTNFLATGGYLSAPTMVGQTVESGNIGALLSVGSTSYLDINIAAATNNVSGTFTLLYATNGVDLVYKAVTRWFFNNSGSDQTLAIPAGWRTNVLSAVPTKITNGTITKMIVECGGPTDSTALQTNCYNVVFSYYK